MASRKIVFAGWDEKKRAPAQAEVTRKALAQIVRQLPSAFAEASTEGLERAEAEVATAESVRAMGQAGEKRLRGGTPGLDPEDPVNGRWAAVVRSKDFEAAKKALAELLELRREVAFEAPDGSGVAGLVALHAPEKCNANDLVDALEIATGGEPPHYLMLVGGPDRFPFELEAKLAPLHAVGRLDVGKTPADRALSWDACTTYAHKVVAHARGELRTSRKALLYSFATDLATSTAQDELVAPVERDLGASKTLKALGLPPDARLVERLCDDAATTAALCKALQRERPAVVLAATHGLESLEAPGPSERWGALTDSTFVGTGGGTAFSASRVPDDGELAAGAVFISCACFSAGVPRRSAHRFFTEDAAGDLPGAPFVSALPRALLAHPKGPIAFVGHVDRATNQSFRSGANKNPVAFLRLIKESLGSATLGQAINGFRQQVASAGSVRGMVLAPLLEKSSSSPDAIFNAWLAYYDAIGYVLLGDPAICTKSGFSP